MFHQLIHGHPRKTKVYYDYESYYNWCETCKGSDYRPQDDPTLDEALRNLGNAIVEAWHIDKAVEWLTTQLNKKRGK